jgi:hypothetical protein
MPGDKNREALAENARKKLRIGKILEKNLSLLALESSDHNRQHRLRCQKAPQSATFDWP